MVNFNSRGAARRELDGAVNLLQQAGTADAFVTRFPGTAPFAERGEWSRGSLAFNRVWLSDRYQTHWIDGEGHARGAAAPEVSLALEMALHEESERRAMEGELKLLEMAWRDAEQIAAIADTLPRDPLHRVNP